MSWQCRRQAHSSTRTHQFNPNPQFNPSPQFNPNAQFIPTTPAKGKRRWGVVILGIIIAVIGLIMLIVGALAGFVEQTRSALDPEAEARTPGALTFDADDETYMVSVQGERFGEDGSMAANVKCTVTFGERIHRRSGRQQADDF